jgi:hypothetical protein
MNPPFLLSQLLFATLWRRGWLLNVRRSDNVQVDSARQPAVAAAALALMDDLEPGHRFGVPPFMIFKP